MITNVRIGNDIRLMWQILDGGVPVNLMNATDIKVSIAQGGTPSCNKIEITTFEVTDAVNGMISVEVQKEVITKIGYLGAVLEYTVPDSSMIDGNRKVTTDNLPVKIVGLTDEASQDSEFTVSSDIQAGFQGLSAFEVWLTQNPDKTEEDYYAWLQKPATDAVSLIDDKIEHLDEVIDSSTENEAERVTAENNRKTAEATRISAETERKANEVERLANESSRASDELIREANESSRKQDEATRKTNENERETAETTRVSNENNRVTAEQARVNAENLRATAESSRELAESLRVEAELLRQSSTQEAISNAENATENANTAAQNADDARLAIQDDLALKANHGYDSSPKTLKEVEDDTINTTEKPTAQSLSELNARITALEAILSNKIKDRVDITKEFNVWGKTNLILYGDGASTKVPDFIGQTYIDTTNSNVYIAVGTSNAGNWKLV